MKNKTRKKICLEQGIGFIHRLTLALIHPTKPSKILCRTWAQSPGSCCPLWPWFPCPGALWLQKPRFPALGHLRSHAAILQKVDHHSVHKT